MKIRITKPIRVNCLSGEVEVTESEFNRLVLLNAVELVKEQREIPEKAIERKTRKTKK